MTSSISNSMDKFQFSVLSLWNHLYSFSLFSDSYTVCFSNIYSLAKLINIGIFQASFSTSFSSYSPGLLWPFHSHLWFQPPPKYRSQCHIYLQNLFFYVKFLLDYQIHTPTSYKTPPLNVYLVSQTQHIKSEFIIIHINLLYFCVPCFRISSAKLLSRVWLFVTPWTSAHQASLSITNSQSILNSCPLSWRCHPTISSSVILFPSSFQAFPESGSF